MSKNKNRYYIAKIEFTEDNYVYDNIEDFTNMTHKEAQRSKIFNFLCEIPYDEFTHTFSYKLKDEEVLSYIKLSDVIDDMVYGFDETYDDENNIIEDENFLKIRTDLLLSPDICVLKEDIKTKLISVVPKHILVNSIKQYIENHDDDFVDEELVDVTCLFLNKIENMIERDSARITLNSGEYVGVFNIVRDNSKTHKKLKKKIDLESKPTINGFVYQGGDDALNFILYNLMSDSIVSCILSVDVSDDKVKEDDKFRKVYGFYITPLCEIFQIDSEAILNCYLTSGEKPDRNTIYCGMNEEDVIYGFDKV